MVYLKNTATLRRGGKTAGTHRHCLSPNAQMYLAGAEEDRDVPAGRRASRPIDRDHLPARGAVGLGLTHG